MIRLVRWLLAICSAASLASCVAVTWFWLSETPRLSREYVYRSHWEADGARATAVEWILLRDGGRVWVGRVWGEYTGAAHVARLAKHHRVGWDFIGSTPRRVSGSLFDVHDVPIAGSQVTGRRTGVQFPLWAAVAATAILPLCWARPVARSMRRRRRVARGVCPACGYDLRASPGRCPECGAEGWSVTRASAGVGFSPPAS